MWQTLLNLHLHSEEHFILMNLSWSKSWTCHLKSCHLIGHFATAGTKKLLPWPVVSHGGENGPLCYTQALIVAYAIRTALVINRDCIFYNPGWLYLLRACHESISVSNLAWRRESKRKVTPSVFLIISWFGWGQVWKLVWLYRESIIISPRPPRPSFVSHLC